jgi:hypothetical protein
MPCYKVVDPNTYAGCFGELLNYEYLYLVERTTTRTKLKNKGFRLRQSIDRFTEQAAPSWVHDPLAIALVVLPLMLTISLLLFVLPREGE